MHATVAIDGLDQSDSGGPFLWRTHARSRLLHVDLDTGVVVAEHDGYRRLPDPVTHRRLVACHGDWPLVVVDRIVCAAAHRVVQTWPLHPSLALAATAPDGVLADRDGEPALALRFAATAPLEIRRLRGEDDPVRGWYSETLEHAEPAWVVQAEATVAGPVDIVAVLSPGPGGERAHGDVEIAFPQPGRVVEIRRADTGATLVLDPGAPRPLEVRLEA
jgi:hypothetical protein